MTGLIVAIIVVLLVVVCAIAFLARSAGRLAMDAELANTLESTGAQRCHHAVALLRLAGRLDRERLHSLWEQIELPLLEAMPDCPPDLKPLLIGRFDMLHGRTKHREYQRRIMAVRNALAS
jgi:hypothetical protein